MFVGYCISLIINLTSELMKQGYSRNEAMRMANEILLDAIEKTFKDMESVDNEKS